MSNELSTEISPEIINSLILTGDMSQLKPAQQTQYYNAICNMLGISPLTQPFAIIVYQGKKTLYARKDCTQQLSNTRKISTEIKERKTMDSVYVVSARATMPEGRFTDDDGIVSISGLKGLELGNAMMKAVTKAKRRAVLALCGLGMPDETEVEDFTNQNQTVDNTKSRVEHIIDTQIETPTEKIDAPKEEIKSKTKEKQSDKPKETEVVKPHTEQTNRSSDPSIKTIIGTIITAAKPASIERDGKAVPKWVFTMGEHKYGTFDESVFQGISSIMDLQSKMEDPILIKIEYKERKSGDKILRDIVNFSQAVANIDVPI